MLHTRICSYNLVTSLYRRRLQYETHKVVFPTHYNKLMWAPPIYELLSTKKPTYEPQKSFVKFYENRRRLWYELWPFAYTVSSISSTSITKDTPPKLSYKYTNWSYLRSTLKLYSFQNVTNLNECGDYTQVLGKAIQQAPKAQTKT